MNRLTMGLCVLAALSWVSCTREMDRPESQQLEFRAVWANEHGTMTVLQPDGTSVWWTTGEEINAFYGDLFSGKFTSTNTENQALVSFRGTLTVLTGTAEPGNAASSYWAVYPYDDSNTCDGESVTLTVPSEQAGVQGTFADKLLPAVATSQSLDLAFYNVCGGARFSVAQSGIISVTFQSNGGEPIAGKVQVGFGSDGVPEVKNVLDGKSAVKVSAPAGGFVPGQYYFAAFLPQTLSSGLSMRFETSSQYATYTTQNSITVHRARFGMLDEMDNGLTFMPIPVESVTLDRSSLDLGVGVGKDLKATVYPDNAADPSVSWFSSDEAVATVSPEGRVTGVAVGSAVITVTTNDGGKTATCNVTVSAIPVADPIDLGLSVKWASFNVGATEPEGYGDYFAWGETSPKQVYYWNTYKWSTGSSWEMTKYCTNDTYGRIDGKTELELADDAAYVNWGSGWRMPSEDQLQELIDNCTTSYATLNGVKGSVFYSKHNDAWLFFPAAGWHHRDDIYYLGYEGFYRSRTLAKYVSNSAQYMNTNKSTATISNINERYGGMSVRAVISSSRSGSSMSW